MQARWRQMEESVTAPRKQERIEIEKALKALKEKKPSKVPKVPYKYDQEALSVRRKGFWALPKAQDLLDDFIPKLSHECDGLILQVTPSLIICATSINLTLSPSLLHFPPIGSLHSVSLVACCLL